MFFKILLLVFIFLRNVASSNFCNPHNVCTNYKGYWNPIFSKDCFCLPDADKDPDVVLTHLLGKNEYHEVTTEDGYILGIYRLRRENPKGVVLLHHPMTVSARVWLNYGNKSTAYTFWKQGYDVWMPNNRGTQYSDKHVNLTTKDAKYWDFSFHEIALYDHKVAIDFISEQTKEKIFFVGHSMSTASIIIYSAYYPEEAKDKLEVVFGMAPVTYYQHANLLTKVLSIFWKPISALFKIMGWHSILKWNAWYIKIGQLILVPQPFKHLFVKIADLLCGDTPKQFDPVFINLFVISGLAEISWKIIFHYMQIIASSPGRFQLYDYGSKQNLKLYGQKQPPLYPLENITVPTYLMYSKEDTVSAFEDNRKLYDNLPNAAKIYGRYEFSGFNHLSYHGGKDRFKLGYDQIFKQIDFIQSNN